MFKHKDIQFFLLVAIICFLSVLSLYFLNFHGSLSESKSEWGTFGDYIGGVLSAIFSFLTILILLISLKNQRTENDEQREFLKIQRFENTFFEMLKFHHEIVNSMEDGTHKGRNCFKHYSDLLLKDPIITQPSNKKLIMAGYDYFFKGRVLDNLSNYFRTLYHIIKLVKNNKDIVDKKLYTNLVRAQLSNSELILLFYNGLSSHGEKFKPLIEDFSLLHNINPESIHEDHKKYYDPKAFL